MVGQRLSGSVFLAGDLGEDGFQPLAMGRGVFSCRSRPIALFGQPVDLLLQVDKLVRRQVLAHTGLVVASGLVEFRAAKPQLPIGPRFLACCRRDEPPEFSEQDFSGLGARLGGHGRLGRIEIGEIHRRCPPPGVSADLLAEPFNQRPVRHGPASVVPLLDQRRFPPAKLRSLLPVDQRPGHPRLDPVAKRPLVFLPRPPVVGHQHPHRHRQQRRRRNGEHHVQAFDVVEVFIGGTHGCEPLAASQCRGIRSSVNTREY